MDLFGKIKLNSYLCRAKKERDGKKHYGKPPLSIAVSPSIPKTFSVNSMTASIGVEMSMHL